MDDEPILDCIVVATSTQTSTMEPRDDPPTTASPAAGAVEQSRTTHTAQPRFEVIDISSDNDEDEHNDSDDEPLAAVRKRKMTNPNPSGRPQKKQRDLAKESELVTLKKQLRDREQRNHVMAAHIASMDPCITALQNEASQAKQDATQAVIAHEKKVDELQKMLNDEIAQSMRLEATVKDLRRKQESGSKETAVKITKLETTNKELQARVKELEDQIEQESAKQAQADDAAKTAKGQIEELQEEVTWYDGYRERMDKQWDERVAMEMKWREDLLALVNNSNNLNLAGTRRAALAAPGPMQQAFQRDAQRHSTQRGAAQGSSSGRGGIRASRGISEGR